jgi:hypothetical protein
MQLLHETLLENKAVDRSFYNRLTVPDESRESELGFRFRSMGTANAGKFMYVL